MYVIKIENQILKKMGFKKVFTSGLLMNKYIKVIYKLINYNNFKYIII